MRETILREFSKNTAVLSLFNVVHYTIVVAQYRLCLYVLTGPAFAGTEKQQQERTVHAQKVILRNLT